MKLKAFIYYFALCLFFNSNPAFSQGTTAFTYQGQLHDNGTNANGAYVLIFKLYDAVTSGNQVGSSITNATTLANGLFTVNLDFGAVFSGAATWLDITITNGGATQTLSPRVQVLPQPYAQFAAIAATVTNHAILNGQIATNAVATTNIQNNAITTAQIANGAVTNRNLTANAVNANNIASGQVVKTLNGLTDLVALAAGANVALVTNGNTLTVSVPENTLSVGNWTVTPGSVSGLSGVLTFSTSSGTQLAIAPSGQGTKIVQGGLNVAGDGGNFGIEVATGNVTVDVGSVTATAFNNSSDRNLKEKFAPVNTEEVLQKVASLPISNWNFKQDASTRHIGPMAQDFYAAFNVGTDNRHIATVDEDGVALAAIQGLNEKLKQKDTQIEALSQRLADLEQLVEKSAQK